MNTEPTREPAPEAGLVCRYADKLPEPAPVSGARSADGNAASDARLRLCEECRAAGQGCRIAEA